MSRPLRVVPAAEPMAVFEALRDALTGDGPAVLPGSTSGAALRGDLPQAVAQKVAIVVETSGSTGAPKRVALSADAVLASAAASASAIGGAGQWLLTLPVHYIAGVNVLVRSLAAQTVPVMLSPGHFDPRAFASAARTLDGDLRFVSLVPTQLRRLLDSDYGPDALRRFDRILVGGQSTPPDLLEHAAELGLAVTRTYGSSETSGGCVYDGVPIGQTRMRIRDGQVQLAGAVLAEGYLADEARTAAAFAIEDGVRWYRTGDTGEIGDGVLRVTGRLDDVIISGGVKVSLAAVERVVRGFPGLGDAVVVPAPSREWGSVPVVVSARKADLEALRDAVRKELGGAAAPSAVVVVPGVLQLASGKPDRVALLALVAAQSSSPSS